MKLIKHSLTRLLSRSLPVLCIIGALASRVASAHPYASNITPTNSNGFVSFTLNEDGAKTFVVYEDGSTNTVPGYDGISATTPTKGTYQFYLEPPHTSFRIICFKQGNGTPALISSDAFSNSVWLSPRGVAVNKNALIGTNFGRLVVGESTAGGTGLNFKDRGLFLLNADQTLVKARSSKRLLRNFSVLI